MSIQIISSASNTVTKTLGAVDNIVDGVSFLFNPNPFSTQNFLEIISSSSRILVGSQLRTSSYPLQ
jgi:hypothetical protein